jgi:predicted anti-sigma-YlaC factor YlaD
MQCERVRELLLTDYLDHQADADIKAQVEAHLHACADCRRFEAEVGQGAVAPFTDVSQPEVPQTIWLNISKRIAERERPGVSIFDYLREKLALVLAPRPVFAFASTMVVFLIIFGLIAKHTMDHNQVRAYFVQQADFFSMLDNGNGSNSQNGELGSAVENYLF